MNTSDQVINILTAQACCDREIVKPEAHLINDLDLDSLDLVEVAMEIEDQCGVEILDDEISSCKTVQDLINHVEARK